MISDGHQVYIKNPANSGPKKHPPFDTLVVRAINDQMVGVFMPRRARIRAKNQPYHIMSRSIPELDLFNCNEDKEYYLKMKFCMIR